MDFVDLCFDAYVSIPFSEIVPIDGELRGRSFQCPSLNVKGEGKLYNANYLWSLASKLHRVFESWVRVSIVA